jgi:hypothetical protein
VPLERRVEEILFFTVHMEACKTFAIDLDRGMS